MKMIISLILLLFPSVHAKEVYSEIMTAKRVYCLIGESNNIMLENVQYRIKENGGYLIYHNSYLGIVEMNLPSNTNCIFKHSKE